MQFAYTIFVRILKLLSILKVRFFTKRGRVKLEPVAKIMAEVLGWDDAQLQEQLCSYHRYIEEIFPPHH
jgi:hypothetical protein